jgi:hypothetical protein
MASIFNKDPSKRPPLPAYARERIAPEIEHLKKKTSVRDAKQQRRTAGVWTLVLLVLGLLWLFFMDPVLHSFKRSDAIRDYLYLHGFGSDAKAQALAETGIFSPPELEILNRKLGAFQDYYATPADADRQADQIIHYMKGVAALRDGEYEKLDDVGKVRYNLFVRFGLIPPASWNVIDPAVNP